MSAGPGTGPAPHPDVGLTLGLDEGSGPLVVLLHGFPELPESWSGLAGPLAAAGYRVVAPYLRGYGDSPAPADPAAYTADRIADDVAGVIEACGEEAAVVIGHDWGVASAWAAAELRPDRVRAVAALSVPFTARSRRPLLERIRERMGDRFFYMLYFTAAGSTADTDLAADVPGFLLACYAGWSGEPPAGVRWDLPADAVLRDQLAAPPAFPVWLDRGGFDAAVATFERTGFRGALNYYRAMDLTWERVPGYGTDPVRCPAFFLAGDRDGVLAFTPTRAMGPPLVSDLRGDVRVPGAGHWVGREAPARTVAELRGFLEQEGVGRPLGTGHPLG